MAAEAILDVTLDGAAHDLGNVFRTIEDAVRLLSSDPKYSSIASVLSRSLERGRGVAEFLRLNAETPADVEQAVTSAVDFAGDVLHALGVHEVEFSRDIEPGLRLRGAPCDWARVLLNLLVNAGEAMKQGGIVDITARRNGDHVEIVIADGGPGIPEALLPQVFRSSPSCRRKGSTMSLHVVESMVKRNGGKISAANRPGGGAQFKITVPI